MKNYLYFGINHTLTANMTGNVTIDTDSAAALAIGNNDLGGQAFQTLLARADVNVHVIPATVTAAYYGTDYNVGDGRRASVIGEPVLLTQPAQPKKRGRPEKVSKDMFSEAWNNCESLKEVAELLGVPALSASVD